MRLDRGAHRREVVRTLVQLALESGRGAPELRDALAREGRYRIDVDTATARRLLATARVEHVARQRLDALLAQISPDELPPVEEQDPEPGEDERLRELGLLYEEQQNV